MTILSNMPLYLTTFMLWGVGAGSHACACGPAGCWDWYPAALPRHFYHEASSWSAEALSEYGRTQPLWEVSKSGKSNIGLNKEKASALRRWLVTEAYSLRENHVFEAWFLFLCQQRLIEHFRRLRYMAEPLFLFQFSHYEQLVEFLNENDWNYGSRKLFF